MMCGHHRSHHHDDHRSADTDTLTAAREPDERLSTADRDRAIDQLRHHAGDGRIDLDEFGERVTTVLAARTTGELAPVLAGLPHVVTPAEQRRRRRQSVAAVTTPYLAVMALLALIWAVTGAGYFWPIWPMLGWGIPVALGLHQVTRTATPSPT